MDPQLGGREAAQALCLLITTCGTAGCFEAMKRLAAVKSPTPLSEVGLDEEGNWRMSVFQRLQWYASDHKLSILSAEDLVRYFGGTLHIEIMERIADHAGLGQYLGRDVGLVTHVLLPLVGNSYSNAGCTITFENSLEMNPTEGGIRFYHLGAIFNIRVKPEVVNDILAEQAASAPFVRSLRKISGQTIKPPEDYLKGLACTADKART